MITYLDVGTLHGKHAGYKDAKDAENEEHDLEDKRPHQAPRLVLAHVDVQDSMAPHHPAVCDVHVCMCVYVCA